MRDVVSLCRSRRKSVSRRIGKVLCWSIGSTDGRTDSQSLGSHADDVFPEVGTYGSR
jgi:hypothetical protein